MSAPKSRRPKTSAADLEKMSASSSFLKPINQSSLKPQPDKTDNRKMAVRHLGIITNRCIFWHQFLPPEIRSHYDVEDMISEVTVTVVKRSHNYNASKGRESTLVWHITDNKCRSILGYYNYKKRSACKTVALIPKIADSLQGREMTQYCHSIDAVERVIRYSSDRVLEVIDKLLNGCLDRSPVSPELIREFRQAADKCAATLDDFVTVMKLCPKTGV